MTKQFIILHLRTIKSFIFFIIGIIVLITISNLTKNNLTQDAYEYNKLSIRYPQYYAYESDNVNLGFIIYGDNNINSLAYSQLAYTINSLGYTTAVVDNSKVGYFFNTIPSSIIENYNTVENWVLIGHGYGASKTTKYAQQKPNIISGIAFLSSNPTEDLSNLNISTLSIYGENDSTIDQDTFISSQIYLPDTHLVIDIPSSTYYGFVNMIQDNKNIDSPMSTNKQILTSAKIITKYFDNNYN